MKYLCIGDIHGKIDIVKLALSDKFKGFHKVFLGDYVDSFTLSTDDQIAVVQLLLKESKREDVTCLIGNHELSYIQTGMRCSGYNSATALHMDQLKDEIFDKFKTHFYINDDILITHAGATSTVFTDKEDVKTALLENTDPRLYNIGRSRGGPAVAGGIYWCDFWQEYKPIKDLTQIVGHSSYRPKYSATPGIIKTDECFNIDCLDRVPEALIVDLKAENNFRILNLETFK